MTDRMAHHLIEDDCAVHRQRGAAFPGTRDNAAA